MTESRTKHKNQRVFQQPAKPDLPEALGLFFCDEGSKNYLDAEGKDEMTREDAESIFAESGRITFFNEDGEKVVICADRDP